MLNGNFSEPLHLFILTEEKNEYCLYTSICTFIRVLSAPRGVLQ